MSQVDRRRIGDRYELIGELGTSASRTVWHARDESTGTDVAIKVLRPELLADPAALGELRAALDEIVRLGHPGILAVSDIVDVDDRIALVSRFVPGGSLRSLLARRGPLPIDRSVSVMAGVCAALDAAHAVGVVHGALTPSQLRLEPDRPAPAQALLADFGMAALINRAAAGGFLPPPPPAQYQAPEIPAGQPGTAAADVYAIGVLLYETLTGHRPFHEPLHGAEAPDRQPSDSTPPIAGLPTALWHTILGCLTPDPGLRPSAEQLAALLVGFGSAARVPSQRAAAGTAAATVSGPPSQPPPLDDATVFLPVIRPDTAPPAFGGQPPVPASRRRLVLAAGGVTVLAVVVAGVITLQPGGNGSVTGAAVQVRTAPGLGSAAAGSSAVPGPPSTQSSPKAGRSEPAVAPASATAAGAGSKAANTGASPSPALSTPAPSNTPATIAATHAGSGTVSATSLKNTYSGLCLDTNGAFHDGTDEQTSTCGNSVGGTWTLTSTGALTQDGGAYCLDDYAFRTAPGSAVKLYSCNGGANQQWTFRADGSIVGVYSGLCLDVAGPRPGNGAPVELWTCNRRSSQQWSWTS
jgi:hypothetical protein